MLGMKFSIEEELPIILLKGYELHSHVNVCYVYMMKWNPTLGEFLKAQLKLENEFDNFQLQSKSKCMNM